MNQVILIGRLTKAPEMSYAEKGGEQIAICKFSLAVERNKDDVSYPRIVAFGKTAENCGKYLDKGRQVAVQGYIKTGSYKNKNGDTVYTTDVNAERVEFLGSKEKTEEPKEKLPAEFEAVFDGLPF